MYTFRYNRFCMFQNLGENQIKEIIHASRVSVFLIDEHQKFTTSNIESIELIKHYEKINR